MGAVAEDLHGNNNTSDSMTNQDTNNDTDDDESSSDYSEVGLDDDDDDEFGERDFGLRPRALPLARVCHVTVPLRAASDSGASLAVYGGHVPRESGGKSYIDAVRCDLWRCDVPAPGGGGGAAVWSRIDSPGSLPRRTEHAALLWRGGAELLVYGGYAGQGTSGGYKNDLYSIDLATGAFEVLPVLNRHDRRSVPIPTSAHSIALWGGYLYKFGG